LISNTLSGKSAEKLTILGVKNDPATCYTPLLPHACRRIMMQSWILTL
jgi:hypothetical protein